MILDNKIKADLEFQKIRDDTKELIEKCEINFYISKDIESIFGILDYPYRLVSAYALVSKKDFMPNMNAINGIYRSKSIILDSGVLHEEITNKRLMKVANALRPTYLVPKDYPQETEKTNKSVKEFFDIKDSYLKYDAELLIPIQVPYRIAPEYMKYEYFGMGGIAKINPAKRKKIIHKIATRYPDKKFHIFGTKPSAMTETLKQYKNIISVDIGIANDVIFSGNIAKGTYSRLPERMYYLYYILNELVRFYNYEPDKMKQQSLFEVW